MYLSCAKNNIVCFSYKNVSMGFTVKLVVRVTREYELRELIHGLYQGLHSSTRATFKNSLPIPISSLICLPHFLNTKSSFSSIKVKCSSTPNFLPFWVFLSWESWRSDQSSFKNRWTGLMMGTKPKMGDRLSQLIFFCKLLICNVAR